MRQILTSPHKGAVTTVTAAKVCAGGQCVHGDAKDPMPRGKETKDTALEAQVQDCADRNAAVTAKALVDKLE